MGLVFGLVIKGEDTTKKLGTMQMGGFQPKISTTGKIRHHTDRSVLGVCGVSDVELGTMQIGVSKQDLGTSVRDNPLQSVQAVQTEELGTMQVGGKSQKTKVLFDSEKTETVTLPFRIEVAMGMPREHAVLRKIFPSNTFGSLNKGTKHTVLSSTQLDLGWFKTNAEAVLRDYLTKTDKIIGPEQFESETVCPYHLSALALLHNVTWVEQNKQEKGKVRLELDTCEDEQAWASGVQSFVDQVVDLVGELERESLSVVLTSNFCFSGRIFNKDLSTMEQVTK